MDARNNGARDSALEASLGLRAGGGRAPTSPTWRRAAAPSSTQPRPQSPGQEGGALVGVQGANRYLRRGRRMEGEAHQDLGRKRAGRSLQPTQQTDRVAGKTPPSKYTHGRVYTHTH